MDRNRAEPWARRVWSQECKVAPGSVEGCSEGRAERWAGRKQAPKELVKSRSPIAGMGVERSGARCGPGSMRAGAEVAGPG